MPDLSFVHRFQPATATGRHPIVLLHGTGADETDLLPLGAAIAPGSALLSPRGKVSEGGMLRFFRRLANSVFDEADIRIRAGELADFVAEASGTYGLQAPIALGFSNGANIAAAVMQVRPETFAGAILLRAMVPLQQPGEADLRGKRVLILSGASDPLMPPNEGARLAGMLAAAGAAVVHQVMPGGHGLTQADVTMARQWLAEFPAA